MVERLAEVYLDAPRNLNIPTTPGRQLWFNGGKATVFYPQDLPAVLRRDDVTVYPSDRYKDWWEDWLTSCGEHQPARAKIEVDGVVHEPPYANLLVAQPPSQETLQDSGARPELAPGEAQGAVLPLKRGPGRPRKVWSPDGEDRSATDPDGQQAAGGSDPFDAFLAGLNDDAD